EPRWAGVEGTFLRHRPYFDSTAISKARAALRNRNGFFDRFDIQDQISADGFFRFSERSVHNEPSVFARNGHTRAFKRAARFGLALRSQSFEPGFVLVDEFLQLFLCERLVPFAASIQQHVSITILCIHFSFNW